MPNGRGAWNNAGLGGTKRYKDASRPGPYYFLGSGSPASGDPDEFAVTRAVTSFQRALTRALGTMVIPDGDFGPQTSAATLKYQQLNEAKTGTPWGGIGPQSSEALLFPYLRDAVNTLKDPRVTVTVVAGTVRHESLWDPGAVGYLDPTDLGLAQINHAAHPEYSREERFDPLTSFNFVARYYHNALTTFDNNTRDAVASYNLGAGGTRTWIKAGRPNLWTPPGSDRERNVKAYIDSILAG